MIAISIRSCIVGSALVLGVFSAAAANATSLEKAVRGIGGLAHQKVPDEEPPSKGHHGKTNDAKGDHATEHGEDLDAHAASEPPPGGPPSRTDGVGMPAPAPMMPAKSPIEHAAPAAATPTRAPESGQAAGVSDEARAQAVINGEQKQAPPHPLQVAAPNDNVIVCEAGCGDAQAHVVYSEPKTALRSVVADAPSSGATLAGKTAECRGGCAYPGLSRPQAGFVMSGLGGPRGLNASVGAWMTSVSTEVAAPVAAPVKKSLREDWMARINREREAKAPTPPVPASEPN